VNHQAIPTRSRAFNVRSVSRQFASVLAFGLAATIAACAQRLGPLTPVDSVHFQIGVTRKTDVANTLGLPTSRSEDQDYEYWNYSDGPAVSSVQVPVVTSITPTVVVTTDNVAVNEEEETVLVCIFRRDGVLASVRDLRGGR